MSDRSSNPGACSAVVTRDGGRFCKHGHAFTYACLGNGYPSGVPIPVCVREDKTFDEARKVITIKPWVGQ